jgi:trimethylamine--corrinoid protein Co-methyltransferase
MRNRQGALGGQYKPLSEEDMEAVHETAFRVLSDVGVQVNLQEGRELFKKAGAQVDEESCVVKIPPDLVREIISKAPSTVTLYGRAQDGRHDLEIGGTRVYMGTGGTALNVQDPGEVSRRASVARDVASMAKVVEELENIHFYMLNVYPNDLEEKNIDVNRFFAGLNNTRKHVMGGVYTVDGVRNVVRMAEYIAGSNEAFKERPFLSMVTCVISPMVIDEKYATLSMEAARNNVPVVVPSEPLTGATSPITLAGNLVVWTADTLAGVMLTQLVNPGSPALAGCVASVTDMRDLKYLSGAVEMGLLNAGAAQMAQYYDLPVYTTAGMSDSKLCDAQAGYESAITSSLVALAGGNFIHDAAGFLEFCMTASFEKLVLDNEIIGMIMRAVQGIEVNETTLAFDAIKEAGPGGHFVSSRHTRRHMRNEFFNPLLSDRDLRETWEAEGAKDARARAAQMAQEILDSAKAPVVPDQVREKIGREIPGIEPSILG